MGRNWGLPPLRIGRDNSRRLGDPLVRREQAPKGDGEFATGGRLGQTSGDPRRHRRDDPRREPDER